MYNKRVKRGSGLLKVFLALQLIFFSIHLDAKSVSKPLSGCLISLLSQASSSNPKGKWLFGLIDAPRGADDVFDDKLVTDKIYTSMITYYIENEAHFGFQEREGTYKNFLDLDKGEHQQIKEAMALEVEKSRQGSEWIRQNVMRVIRAYDVPANYRDYQRRRSGAN